MDRSERTPRWGLVLGLLGLVSLFLLRDLLAAVLGGILWAVLAWPLHRLARRRLRNSVAAAATLTVTAFAVVGAFGGIAWLVASDLQDVAHAVQDGSVADASASLPAWVSGSSLWPAAEAKLATLTTSMQGRLAHAAAVFLVQLPIAVFVAFACLREGNRLVLRVQRAIPLPTAQAFQLLEQAARSARGVARGQVLTALLKGSIGAIGFALAGVPNPTLWGLVMSAFVFLPVLAAWMVWAPAAAWLFANGHPIAAVFLAGWGALVMGLSDNIVRPILVGKQARLHPVLVLLGVAGGAATLGVVGLFAGPVLLGAAASAFNAWTELRTAQRARPVLHPRPAPQPRPAAPVPAPLPANIAWPRTTAASAAHSLLVPLPLALSDSP